MYELRKNTAFGLLDERNECFVREGSDDRVYICGETEILENEKAKVRPVARHVGDAKSCFKQGLKYRKTATSTACSDRTGNQFSMRVIR